MNNQRRKDLKKVIADLEQWKDDASDLVSRIEDIKSEIEAIKDEEEEAYYNLPEVFQDGERGEKMQSAMISMESAIDSVDEVVGDLERLAGESVDDIIEYLREAIDA